VYPAPDTVCVPFRVSGGEGGRGINNLLTRPRKPRIHTAAI